MKKKMSVFCICLCSLLCIGGMGEISALFADDSMAVKADASVVLANDYIEETDGTSHCEENECYLKYKIDEENHTAIASSYYMGNIPYWDEMPKEIVIAETYNGYPVTAIGNGAFGYTTFFEAVIIPDSIQKIGKGAFNGAVSLKSITIPDGVTEIEDETFEQCNSLEKVGFPNSVTAIGAGAFSYCDLLQEINFPDSITIIGASALYRCISLEEIHFPAELKELGGACCESCTSLKTVYLSDKLERIRSYAFEDTALTDVYYDGTKEQWKAIQIDENNTVLENATIHFNAIAETTQNLTGDIDGDNDIDIVDVIALNQHLLGVSQISGIAEASADVDGNGILNDADAMYILKYIVRLISDFASLKA